MAARRRHKRRVKPPAKPRPAKKPRKPSKRGSVAVARAEKAAGGMRALAARLGVSPSTINRWRTKGLTKVGRAKLEVYKKQRSEVRRTKREQRKAFEELMSLASKESVPERKRLPVGRTREGPRRGPLTQGFRYTRAWNRVLTEDLVSDIIAWMHGVQKRFPIWQAVTVVSQYGKGEHRGYKSVHFQLPHPEVGDFTISAQIATKKSTVREDVISSMETKLEEMVEDTVRGDDYGEEDEEDEGDEEGSLQVYVHSTTVFNYRMRTDRERQQFETRKRNERRKAWAKKQLRK